MEDFLRRLAFSIVRLKAVGQDLQYLTIAGVDQVSKLITDVFPQPEKHRMETVSCVDGVAVPTFCDVLSRQKNMPIKRMKHQKWIELLKKNMEEAEFEYPFMPIFDWLKENTWQFVYDQESIPENRYFDQKETIAALDSSVNYMKDIGYLSHDFSQKHLNKSSVFSRSTC